MRMNRVGSAAGDTASLRMPFGGAASGTVIPTQRQSARGNDRAEHPHMSSFAQMRPCGKRFVAGFVQPSACRLMTWV